MAISDETMWTAVVCGLIAHADGVLDGEECELLLALIEEEADGDEYAEWLANLGSQEALERLFERLPTPKPSRHRDLLERAWTIAMVDGERTEPELQVLRSIAEQIGVESIQLDFWLEAWATAEDEFSSATVAALAAVVQGQVDDDVGRGIEQIVDRLPVSEEKREELRLLAEKPGDLDEATRGLNNLSRPRRLQLFRMLLPITASDDRRKELFVTLAESVGLRDRAEKLLDSN